MSIREVPVSGRRRAVLASFSGQGYNTRKKGGTHMRYTWIDAYLLEKTGVTKDLQKDWNWIRYHIGGKM